MPFTIAIDGPAAAGKGTISRALADHYGFAPLDTGLLYRVVGVQVLEGADPVATARALTADMLARTDLRTAEAGAAASKVAMLPDVRAALVDFQRAFARRDGGAVLDGRDIGTVICPLAEVKLFITASAEVRARRRYDELCAAGQDTTYDTVLADVQARDDRDMNRAEAPLRPATDAVTIDTSTLDVAAAIAAARRVIDSQRSAP